MGRGGVWVLEPKDRPEDGPRARQTLKRGGEKAREACFSQSRNVAKETGSVSDTERKS